MKMRWKSVMAGCAVALATSGAGAATVTLIGSQFDVVYDDALLGPFGTPTLQGGALVFIGNTVAAQSLNGTGSMSVNAALSGVIIVPKAGLRVHGFSWSSFGDYNLAGAGSAVQVSGLLEAFDTSAAAATRIADALTVSAATPLNLADGLNHDWLATAQLDAGTAPAAGASGNVFALGATAIGLAFSTTLTATTVPGGGLRQAFIEHKVSGVQVSIRPSFAVPVSGTGSLALLGLTLLAATPAMRRWAQGGADRRVIGAA